MASWLYEADVAFALTILGNEHLRAHSPGKALSPSSFVFGEHIRFATRSNARPDGKELIPPETWVSEATNHGYQRFGLHYIQSPEAAFDEPGRGQWHIEAMKADVSDFWQGVWSFGDTGVGRVGLVVTYSRSNIGTAPLAVVSKNISTARAELETTLQEIRAYAQRSGLGHFNLAFDQALTHLHAEQPSTQVIYTDFNWNSDGSEVLSLDAKQLVAAARSAWCVFGSMGAWNDRPLNQCSERHIDLTRRLSIR